MLKSAVTKFYHTVNEFREIYGMPIQENAFEGRYINSSLF
jgi:hypothetical protein